MATISKLKSPTPEMDCTQWSSLSGSWMKALAPGRRFSKTRIRTSFLRLSPSASAKRLKMKWVQSTNANRIRAPSSLGLHSTVGMCRIIDMSPALKAECSSSPSSKPPGKKPLLESGKIDLTVADPIPSHGVCQDHPRLEGLNMTPYPM